VWRETTKHQRNLKIWREELDGFVPEKVLDFHVHLFDAPTLPQGQTFPCAGHDITQYGFDDIRQDLAEAYPRRKISAVCFGIPSTKYDRVQNNRYVAAGCDKKIFFPFRLIDPHEDPAGVKQDIIANGFAGLKPYHDYVGKDDPNQVEIHEMLPAGIMKIADELGLIVMLHIPRNQRLADPVNQKQIVELCTAWPKAKIVLAHIGRAYYLKNIVGQLDNLKDLPNLYYDTAMLNNSEVLEYLFRNVESEKILYGTDIPIALAPGKSVEINDQYTYVTPVPWSLSISDDHKKIIFTSFLYEQLRAVKKAVRRLNLSDTFIQGLFYENGMHLLQTVI